MACDLQSLFVVTAVESGLTTTRMMFREFHSDTQTFQNGPDGLGWIGF